MKSSREHRVPLSARALAILEDMKGKGAYIFPGAKAGKPLSNIALLMTLRRMDLGDLTTHGFRSTFRDWCGDCTEFSARGCRGSACERGWRQGRAIVPAQ